MLLSMFAYLFYYASTFITITSA